MSRKPRTSFTHSQTLDEALSEIAHQKRTSKSEIVRIACEEFVLNNDDDEVEIPEHHRIPLARERIKKQGKPAYLRATFRQRVYKQHKGLLKKGLSPEEIRMVKPNYIEEAEELFQDEKDLRESRIQYVEQVSEAAQEANDVSDFGRLDPDNFEKFGGVERGRDKAEVEAKITQHVEEAVDLITDDMGGRLGNSATDPEQVIEILSNRSDIPDGVAEEIVEDALDVIEGDTSIEEISVGTSPGASDRAATDGGDR
jgi:hypothetical protein